MREHPIPQDITGYRFHIIGSMTLKQFAEIGIGVAIAAVFYSTNLPAIIKWPFIGISIALGAAAAFLPIEERPLDHWIITFFKVLYKPTVFYWKRKPNIPTGLSYTAHGPITPLEPEIDLSPIRRQRIKEYIGSVAHPHSEPFDLSNTEQERVASILSSFTTQPVVTAVADPTPQPTQEKPDLEVRIRKLRPNPAETVVYSTAVSAPQAAAITPEPTGHISPPQTPVQAPIPQATPVTTVGAINTTNTISANPEPEHSSPPDLSPPIAPQAEQVEQVQLPTTAISQPEPQIQPVVNQSVSYNTDLPFPSTPTEPNKVVGMVLTPENDLISDAIVEIQMSNGTVARAVKSNALGQFFITTPLAAGEYTIMVEKDGFTFSPLQLVLSDQIVQPIEIRSA